MTWTELEEAVILWHEVLFPYLHILTEKWLEELFRSAGFQHDILPGPNVLKELTSCNTLRTPQPIAQHHNPGNFRPQAHHCENRKLCMRFWRGISPPPPPPPKEREREKLGILPFDCNMWSVMWMALRFEFQLLPRTEGFHNNCKCIHDCPLDQVQHWRVKQNWCVLSCSVSEWRQWLACSSLVWSCSGSETANICWSRSDTKKPRRSHPTATCPTSRTDCGCWVSVKPSEGEFTQMNVMIVTEIMVKVMGILRWSNLSVWSQLWQQTSQDLLCCFSNTVSLHKGQW